MKNLKLVGIGSALGGLTLLVVVGILAPVHPAGTVLVAIGAIGVLATVILLLFFNLRTHLDLVERQILALHSAVALTQVQLPRPAFFLRHAVAPDFIELVAEIMRRRGSRRILELGCGTSSLYFSSLLPCEAEGGVLVCLENSVEWAQLLQQEIEHISQPRPKVRVVHAPLMTLPETGSEFYDLKQAALASDSPFDLLIVDGPSDMRLRKAAFDLLPGFLTPTAVIMLDDGRDPAIQSAVRTWLKLSAGWSARFYDTVKGTWILWNQKSIGIPFP